MSKILILPDIHGRSFWKESVDIFINEFPLDKEENRDNRIIFLGDYVDPYEWIDHVSNEDAYLNLLDLLQTIVDMNAKHKGTCIMLLGNHDLHYIYDTGEDCRLDYHRYPLYRKIFNTLIESGGIQIAYAAKMRQDSKVNWLFSHAGVQLEWFAHVAETQQWEIKDISAQNMAFMLNTHMTDSMKQLAEVSAYRGGYAQYGSCLWADLEEMKGNNVVSQKSAESGNGEVRQVFAHTYSSMPYIDERTGIYMIDTGFSSYLLDENDKLNVYVKGDRSSSF